MIASQYHPARDMKLMAEALEQGGDIGRGFWSKPMTAEERQRWEEERERKRLELEREMEEKKKKKEEKKNRKIKETV